MATDVAVRVGNALASALGVPPQQVIRTLDGDTLVLTVTGQLQGRSPKNAIRRRQRGLSVAKRAAAGDSISISVTYAVQDAVSILEESIRAAAAVALGKPPDSMSFHANRAGEASVVLVMSVSHEGDQTKLQRVIAPLLHSSDLSLVELSLVSEMREDIPDGRLLRLVKTLAPCDATAIAKKLRARNEATAPVDSIHRRLDSLRQKGLLTYVGDRKFAMTLSGLGSVPVSARKKTSSDIDRILALGRRRW